MRERLTVNQIADRHHERWLPCVDARNGADCHDILEFSARVLVTVMQTVNRNTPATINTIDGATRVEVAYKELTEKHDHQSVDRLEAANDRVRDLLKR